MGDATLIPVKFGRALRDAGVVVTVAETIDYSRALAAVDCTDPGGLYWAGRATLTRDPDDIATYDAVFGEFFHGRASGIPAEPPVEPVVGYDAAPEPDSLPGGDGPGSSGPRATVRWSRAEVLGDRDFASLSAAEWDETRRLIADITFRRATQARRRSRRFRRSHHTGRLDVRATARAALAHGGEPVLRVYKAPMHRARRVVLLCDVSGSMEPYTRVLLRFFHAVIVARREVEAFAFGTRLTRITAALSSRDPDAAIAQAATRVPDIGGGTRLGDGLRTFNDQWGIPGIARGATIVILSDGWDRGEPELLGTEMVRLGRVAHRIVWVNPLKAGAGYAPVARGMAAALASIDDFVEGHSLNALIELACLVEGPER